MRDIEANMYAEDIIQGKRSMVINGPVISFVRHLMPHHKRVMLSEAWEHAKIHNARFSLFVLELIKRKKS